MFNLNGTTLRVVTRSLYGTIPGILCHSYWIAGGIDKILSACAFCKISKESYLLNNTYTYDVKVEKTINARGPTYSFTGGFGANLFMELSRYINFGYDLMNDPNLTYRFDLATNSSIDIFAASFSLTEARALCVDPTFVTGLSKIQVFLNHEFELSMYDLVLRPFRTDVWLVLGLLLVIFSISIGISILRNEQKTIFDGAFQIFAVFCQQDCKIIFATTPSRTIMWTASISSLMLLAAYSGTVVSMNAVKKYSIRSLDEVVASNYDMSFDVGFNNDSTYQQAAEAMNDIPAMRSLFIKISKSAFRFENFERAFKRVEKEPFAYIIDEETVEKALGYFPCEYSSFSFAQVKYPWVMFMHKGSRFRPAINYGIQKFRETGHLRYFIQRWIPGNRKRACSKRSKENFSSIQLKHLRSSFIIFVAGAFIAGLALVLELFHKIKPP